MSLRDPEHRTCHRNNQTDYSGRDRDEEAQQNGRALAKMDHSSSLYLDTESVSQLTQSIQLHENQRCWIGRGFSDTLLPNDRGKYSTLDGSQSWKSLEEAANAVLGPTWKWKQADSTSDNEWHEYDWYYARDFTVQAVGNAKPNKRNPALHWVRYRTIQRSAVFVPEVFKTNMDNTTNNGCDDNEVEAEPLAKGCQNCDSKAVKSLAQNLLEVLAYVALIQSGGPRVMTATTAPSSNSYTDSLDDSTLLRIKADLAQFLIYQSTTNISQDDVTTAEAQQDSFCQLQKLHQSLSVFANNQIAKYKAGNILRSVTLKSTPSFEKRQELLPDPQFHHVCQSISERCFSQGERASIAFCIIKHLDKAYCQMQCHSMMGCNNDKCDYTWVQCPNEGCFEIMSRVYIGSHVECNCVFRRVTCDCGDEFAKHQQLQHLKEVCPLREAPCPFAHLGCTAVLKAKEIPPHVEKETGSHLLLALQRMKEYEIQFRRLHDRIDTLQSQQKSTSGFIQSQNRNHQTQQQRVDRQLAVLQKQLRTLETSTSKNIRQLKDQRSHAK